MSRVERADPPGNVKGKTSMDIHELTLWVFVFICSIGWWPLLYVLIFFYLAANGLRVSSGKGITVWGYIVIVAILFVAGFSNSQFVKSDSIRDLIILTNPVIIFLLARGVLKNTGEALVLEVLLNATRVLTILAIALFVIRLISGSFNLSSLYHYRNSLPAFPYEVFVFLCLSLFKTESKLLSFPVIGAIILILLYFSRNFFLMLSVLFILRYYKNTFKLVFVLLMFLIVFSLFVFSSRWSGAEQFLFKILNSYNELFVVDFTSHSSIIHNWRAYELYKGLQQFSSYTTWNQLFGVGLGARIALNGEYWLSGTLYSSLPFLHNGFVTMLVKVGVLPFFVFVYFFFFPFNLNVKFSCVSFNKALIYRYSQFVLVLSTFLVMGIFSASLKVGTFLFLMFVLRKN